MKINSLIFSENREDKHAPICCKHCHEAREQSVKHNLTVNLLFI